VFCILLNTEGSLKLDLLFSIYTDNQPSFSFSPQGLFSPQDLKVFFFSAKFCQELCGTCLRARRKFSHALRIGVVEWGGGGKEKDVKVGAESYFIMNQESES
jgi:hypothetical protein